MSLSSQLASFKQERADAVSRNINHSRPANSTPARTSTPQPAAGIKRERDVAFSNAPAVAPVAASGGHEILTNVKYAIDYLKSKQPQSLPFDEIVRHLSLPADAEQRNTPTNIRKGLITHDQVEYISKSDRFKYRPKHPVTSAEELKEYLARQPTAQGILVKELKDGWPNCQEAITTLEKEGAILVIHNKKDGTPKTVFRDSPSYHLHVDEDFKTFWIRTKLPSTEAEVRAELEKAGITPTSQVKEVKKLDMKKKERKRPNRRGGKVTNSHMNGILKEYKGR